MHTSKVESYLEVIAWTRTDWWQDLISKYGQDLASILYYNGHVIAR